jgi:hypothetical protein
MTWIAILELLRAKLRHASDRRKRKASKDPILRVAGIYRGPILSAEIDRYLYSDEIEPE